MGVERRDDLHLRRRLHLRPLKGRGVPSPQWRKAHPNCVPTIEYLTVAILINYVMDHSEGWAAPLNWGPVAWVGRLSYSLYIWQQLFCWDSPLGWAGRFPQNLVITFAMASLSYYFVEQPFAKLRRGVRFVPSQHLASEIRVREPLAAGIPASTPDASLG